MTNERRARIRALAVDATRQIQAAVDHAGEDTAWGDELAKEALALSTLTLERLRKLLDAPVLATERMVSRSMSTMPASEGG
jgi:hypothetical protein